MNDNPRTFYELRDVASYGLGVAAWFVGIFAFDQAMDWLRYVAEDKMTYFWWALYPASILFGLVAVVFLLAFRGSVRKAEPYYLRLASIQKENESMTKIRHFVRKDPGAIEAMQWDGTAASAKAICAWVCGNQKPQDPVYRDDGYLEVYPGLRCVLAIAPKEYVVLGDYGWTVSTPDLFESRYVEMEAGDD